MKHSPVCKRIIALLWYILSLLVLLVFLRFISPELQAAEPPKTKYKPYSYTRENDRTVAYTIVNTEESKVQVISNGKVLFEDKFIEHKVDPSEGLRLHCDLKEWSLFDVCY